MIAIFEKFGFWIFEKFAGSYIDKMKDRAPLNFTGMKGRWFYSHYKGQDHVRQGGTKMIYKAAFDVTIHNPTSIPKTIRQLKVICTLDGVPYPFHLYDQKERNWKGDYNIGPHSVSTFSWEGVPEGYGLLAHDPGILSFTDESNMQFRFNYINDHGKCLDITISNVERYRLRPEVINE